MIVSVRGTNGAGKSHLVRTVFERYATDGGIKLQYPKIGRKKVRPYGAIFMRDKRRLFVPGHYEITNGGIDTIHSLPVAYDLIWKHHEIGCDVIYEGMNQDSATYLLALKKEYDWDVRVVLLSTPLAACVASARAQCLAVGHKINEETIRKIYAECERDYVKFADAGMRCARYNRETAAEEVFEWLTM